MDDQLMINRSDILYLAVEAGIVPWTQLQWSKDRFVSTDEGMDGDAANLLQFAGLIMEVCAQTCEQGDKYGRWTSQDCANAIREQMMELTNEHG